MTAQPTIAPGPSLLNDCTCKRFRGDLGPDHDAERVAALIPTLGQWLASLTVFAPQFLPARVSVSERLRRRLRESGHVSDTAAAWAVCLFTLAFVLAVWWLR